MLKVAGVVLLTILTTACAFEVEPPPPGWADGCGLNDHACCYENGETGLNKADRGWCESGLVCQWVDYGGDSGHHECNPPPSGDVDVPVVDYDYPR